MPNTVVWASGKWMLQSVALLVLQGITGWQYKWSLELDGSVYTYAYEWVLHSFASITGWQYKWMLPRLMQ